MIIKVITLSLKVIYDFMTLKHQENPYLYNISNFAIEGYHISFIKHRTSISSKIGIINL